MSKPSISYVGSGPTFTLLSAGILCRVCQNSRSIAIQPMIRLRHCFLTTLVIAASPLAAGFADDDLSFNRDIRPIFSKTCFACHGPDSHAREADLRLDLQAEATTERDGVQPIVPGDADSSPVFQRVSAADPDEQMPPPDFHTQLTEREKALLKRWIDEGAEYEEHWAFIPPVRPDVPAQANPIDHWVQAKLPDSVTPAEQADRATLVRRVSLDLTGIPPTPAEVNAFVNDPAEDDVAYKKVVDRLLASPRYAEQRTRYWLDAARYADTSGYQYDKIRDQWVWRDWVIHAFDSNMPFDEFTIAQTAGDLLPDLTPQTRLATGFHRNHPITIEGGVIDEEYRTEYVMDRVVTSTTTWLGLTFLCARCHDHKYDPISQDDFYSFYAFFNSVPERGLNGFDPKAKIESPLNPIDLTELDQALANAEQRFESEVKKLDGEMAAWEEQIRKQVDDEVHTVAIDRLAAQHNTNLVQQDDGSILATGANPPTQVYEIEFRVEESPLRSIRLEALTHDRHANKSTGRGSNGNFVLSEVRVKAARGDAEFQSVKIASASASYEQKGYPVTAAIDGKTGRGGWAVDGNSRIADSTAVFTLEESPQPGTRVRFLMEHTWGGSHTIGHFRLAVQREDNEPVPAAIRELLTVDASRWDAAQRSEFSRYLALRFGGDTLTKLDQELKSARAKRDRAISSVPDTMVLSEMPKPRETFVLMRGEYDKPIDERQVEPNIPGVLGGLPDDLPRDRLGLARWLVSRDNPLTARVTVNRFWAQLFGVGLVKTIEDFGSQGEYPSHPELLDWLAVEFMESGWDVKHLFRTLVTSRTYRQSSRLTPEAHANDPDNRMLARGPRHRLDAEAIRDSALAVSGLLNAKVGGPSVYPYHPEGLWMEINNRPGYSRAYPHTEDASALYRRSLYTFWKRTVPPPSLAAFDAPGREFCMVKRSRTNTPLQAFVMLHDPQYVEAARKLGERMMAEADDAERLQFGFELCLAREPKPQELKSLQHAFETRLAYFKANPDEASKLLGIGESPLPGGVNQAELAAYATVGRILLNLSEFITKG